MISVSSVRQTATLLAAVLLLGSACPRTVRSQTVRGMVTGDASASFGGAVVVLSDASGRTVARAAASADGMFQLGAPAPGVYRIRAIRLGFRPTPWQPIDVPASGVAGVRLAMVRVPVALARVSVEAERRCEVRPDSATMTFRAWEAAQAVLHSVNVTENEGRLRLLITTFDRSMTADGALLALRQMTRPGNVRTPFAATLSPAEFAARGFVEETPDGGVIYRAPDAAELLSPEFLASHCFRLTDADSAHAGQVGLYFEPTRGGRDLSDVQGTLWLDSRTSELRTLEWRYTDIDPAAAEASAGGRLAFAPLPAGNWVVTDWTLRMPVVSEVANNALVGSPLRGPRVRRANDRVVRRIEETGGFVASVRDDERDVWTSAGAGRRIRVVDAGTHAPVAGAAIALHGTAQTIFTDSSGHAAFPYLVAGHYSAGITRPTLASAGVAFDVALDVERDRVDPAEVALPSDAEIVSIVCEGQYEGADRAIVSGSVSANDGTIPGRVVLLRATSRGEMRGLGSRGAASTIRETWTRTDAAGRFHLCGLPWDEEVIVQAPEESGSPGERVQVKRDVPVSVNIVLAP